MSCLHDINGIFNISEEEIKTVVPKKNLYCHNCNKKGHIYKYCNEPKISNGIIAFHIRNFKKSLIPILEKFIIKNIKNNNLEKTIQDNNFIINNKIKFLMVQRKHSLGFLEFMRGKYNINNIFTVTHLIKQMTPEEIIKISNEEFDALWNNLWNNNENCSKSKQMLYKREYVNSKEKFYNLKVNHKQVFETKSSFTFNEWGFPKGRRELYEPDLICSMREFEEETSFSKNNYIILENCDYIREDLKGTDGVNYAHNYFFAIMDDDNFKDNEDYHKNKENNEIGDIKFMNINECMQLIRPYHRNKIKIIKKVYCIINTFLEEHDFEI